MGPIKPQMINPKKCCRRSLRSGPCYLWRRHHRVFLLNLSSNSVVQFCAVFFSALSLKAMHSCMHLKGCCNGLHWEEEIEIGQRGAFPIQDYDGQIRLCIAYLHVLQRVKLDFVAISSTCTSTSKRHRF